MFLSRYQDRPSKLDVDYEIKDGDREGTVHSLHDFVITVWKDGEVTAQRRRHVSHDPAGIFPNMTVNDGSINLPIEDLVSFILARITPVELAEGLMADDEAREALVYKMAERYSGITFEDADRRKFLTKVQQQVYSVSLDNVVTRLTEFEENHRSRYDYYRWRAVELNHYKTLYEYTESLLSDVGVVGDDKPRLIRFINSHVHPDTLKEFIEFNRDPVVTESVGPEWRDSREYWRKKLAEFFLEPELPKDE